MENGSVQKYATVPRTCAMIPSRFRSENENAHNRELPAGPSPPIDGLALRAAHVGWVSDDHRCSSRGRGLIRAAALREAREARFDL